MYTFIRSVAKAVGVTSKWSNLDISKIKLCDLYRDYAQSIAVVKDQFMTEPEALDLASIKVDNVTNQQTLLEFLTSNGNKTLPTTPRLPSLVTKYVKYNCAHRAGYKITPVGPNEAPDAKSSISDKTWLHLGSKTVDFNDFNDYALVSVNGLFHYADASSSGAWVMDAMRSCHVSGKNRIGIYSFKNVGKLTKIPIRESMLTKFTYTDEKGTHNVPLRDRFLINTKTPLKGKTVGIVIGGYLHLLDEKTIRRHSDNALFINTANIPIIERYFETINLLDYSTLRFDRNKETPWLINVDDFLSDENLTGYLTMSQNFIVLIDNPNVYVYTKDLNVKPGRGTAVEYQEPTHMLRTGRGQVREYWRTFEDGQWAISTDGLGLYNRQLTTTRSVDIGNVNDGRVPGFREVKKVAEWFCIATDI